MALLNADKYKNLAEMSAGASTRKPGKFFSAFICGEMRDKQRPGTYQCMKNFDEDTYFVNNANEIYFLPLYIKRYWTKYVDMVSPTGNKYPKLVAFGWKDNIPKCEGAKYEYVIAGYLYDAATKQVVKHDVDMPDAGINAGDKVMIFFRCAGVKCGSGMDLINRMSEKEKTLPADQKIVDDNAPANFKALAAQHHYLVKAGIGSRKTNFGNRMVFDFYPETVLPEKVVASLLDDAERLRTDFEEQFDKTSRIESSEGGQSEQFVEQTNTTVEIDDIPSVQSSSSPASEFEIDI